MNSSNEILTALAQPFHPAHVTWKPGVFSRDKTKAMALAYADLRAYMQRLDEVCGLNWSVTYTPWGDRLVCHLTIAGVTRSSTGEPDSQSEKSEIAGTATEAQAFKRACAMFGLGRYLYNLPTVWAEYDSGKRQFTEQGKTRLNGIVVQHYQRNTNGEEGPTQSEPQPLPKPRTNSGATKPQPSPEPEQSNGTKPWADDPHKLIRSHADYQFGSRAEAIGWGLATGVFSAWEHAENAYEEVKREKQPKSPAAMWALWLDEVAARVNERAAA